MRGRKCWTVGLGWVLNLLVIMLFVGELARFVAGELVRPSGRLPPALASSWLTN